MRVNKADRVFLNMLTSKIQLLFTTRVDSRPGNPRGRVGQDPVCSIRYYRNYMIRVLAFGQLVVCADCDTWDLRCNISYFTLEPMCPRDLQRGNNIYIMRFSIFLLRMCGMGGVGW